MTRKLVKKIIEELLPQGDGGSVDTKPKGILSASEKREIKRAQDRLRRSDDFVKEIARNQGIERLTLKGSDSDKILTLKRARYINDTEVFTKRGFKQWKKDLAEDTRLSASQIDFILSQIDAEKMDYVQNSRLRYGSNPQLDYVLDSANEIKGRYQSAIEELQKSLADFEEDIF